MAIMEVIRVISMLYSGMSAVGAVLVFVVWMCFTITHSWLVSLGFGTYPKPIVQFIKSILHYVMKCLAGRQDLKRKPGADVLGLRSSVVESGQKLLVGEGLEERDQCVHLFVV